MAAAVDKPVSAPERIDRTLTRAILRGAYPAGAHLPTLRALAALHGVNPSTMQRALARLESRGLVTARQGSGYMVNDPATLDDLSLVTDWLVVTADDPDRSSAILEDLLEIRRVVAARLVSRHRLAVLDAMAGLSAGADQLLDVPAERVWEVDLAVARVVIAATGNTVATLVVNAVARALAELPLLVRAMYAEPVRNAESMVEVFAAVRDGGDGTVGRIEAAMAAVDRHTVTAYRRLLDQQSAA